MPRHLGAAAPPAGPALVACVPPAPQARAGKRPLAPFVGRGRSDAAGVLISEGPEPFKRKAGCVLVPDPGGVLFRG